MNERSIIPVKTSIVGSGGITTDVMPYIEKIDEIEIVCFQDIRIDSAREKAEKYGVGRYSDNFDEVLNDDSELVILNTPNDCHRDQAVAVLKAGKHCLVQKPIARTSIEAKEIIDASVKHGKLLGTVMLERANPIYRQVKAMVQAGCFGPVTFIRSTKGHTYHMLRQPAMTDWRCIPDKIGGGSFIQLAVHHIDIAQFVTGLEISEVTAISSSMIDKKRFPDDETTSATVRFKNGAIGEFTSSFTIMIDSLELYGPGGRIRKNDGELNSRCCSIFRGELFDIAKVNTDYTWRTSDLEPEFTKLMLKYDPHRQFAYAIRGEAQVEVTGEDGFKELQIVEAVYKSVRDGKTVDLNS
jgi:predicted dehydrogenase